MEEAVMKEGIRAILVGASGYDQSAPEQVEKELDELERLLETAGGVCYARVIQNKDKPDPRTYIGSGKVKEIADMAGAEEIGLVVFDFELSPSQIRNLEEAIGHDVRVIDRSMLILDIFALHAVTGEGKLQVELAQLQYTAPRLTGNGKDLSRLGGGIGTRGPGESKLETDRRHMKRRMESLRAELAIIEKNRKTMRAARERNGVLQIAIVGYTNAGKSTLLNRLTDAGILAENKLFATLDPTTRKYSLPSGEEVLLTDTVGFIRKLPHHLVEAFRSTLDAAATADALLILMDASDPEYPTQLAVTSELLESLGAGGKPTLYVMNQCDKISEKPSLPGSVYGKCVCISARTGEGISDLTDAITELIRDGKHSVTFVIPNTDAGALQILYKNASVESVEYTDSDILATAVVDAKTRGMLKAYDPNYPVPTEE